MLGQRFRAVKVIDRQKVVDVGQRRLHSLGERLIAGGTKQGIKPDQAVALQGNREVSQANDSGAPRSQPLEMIRTTATPQHFSHARPTTQLDGDTVGAFLEFPERRAAGGALAALA